LQYNFEWDPAKAKQNIQKHGVSFQRAGTIFRDPHAISIFDGEHSQEEERWVTMGRDSGAILLVVSHTFHEVNASSYSIRIISARKATKKEKRQYEERNS
jgi:uncharacterized DUF497 family protein